MEEYYIEYRGDRGFKHEEIIEGRSILDALYWFISTHPAAKIKSITLKED